MPNAFLFAVFSAVVLLALGVWLRATIRWLRLLYIPAAVVAGIIGFALIQAGSRIEVTQSATVAIARVLASWPSWLIALVFAGLLLERSSGKGFTEAMRRGARSGILAWIIILGQIVIGLVVYLVAVRPFHSSIHPSFGQLLEVSWAGGYGSATGMGAVYRDLGFPEGQDLGLFLATVGLIYGVISGLVLVNLAVRRGWLHTGQAASPVMLISGLEPPDHAPPVAFGPSRREVIDPLALQLVILLAAFAVGYAYQQAFIAIASQVFDSGPSSDPTRAINSIQNIPLFLFTLLGGLTVRWVMTLLRIDHLIDGASIQRFLGIAMEFLIVSAIATMRVEAVALFIVPVTALLVLAAVWSAICLLVLSPRLLPRRYWFELGLLNYGFSTATTAQGLMLLRIVDPELKTGAAEDYAVAAPLSAPFVGGGIITFVGLPWLLGKVPAGWVILAMCVVMVALYLLGRQLGQGEQVRSEPQQTPVSW